MLISLNILSENYHLAIKTGCEVQRNFTIPISITIEITIGFGFNEPAEHNFHISKYSSGTNMKLKNVDLRAEKGKINISLYFYSNCYQLQVESSGFYPFNLFNFLIEGMKMHTSK